MAAKALTVEQCREALDVLARCGAYPSRLPPTSYSRSGFAVLTFRKGRLLHPELCLVHSEEAGIVEFRGEEVRV